MSGVSLPYQGNIFSNGQREAEAAQRVTSPALNTKSGPLYNKLFHLTFASASPGGDLRKSSHVHKVPTWTKYRRVPTDTIFFSPELSAWLSVEEEFHPSSFFSLSKAVNNFLPL